MGIIKAEAGTVTIAGRNALRHGVELRQRIGYVPDVPYMYPSFTCKDMFRLGSKLYPGWDWQKCRQLSEVFAIPENKRFRTLSRGFKTRTALVMALAIRPRLLVLDEPTAGMDPFARDDFRQVLIDEVVQNGITVFYSTHDLNEMERTTDHIAAIKAGHLLFQKPVDEIKENFHRVRLVFDEEPPPEVFTGIPGVIETEGFGKGFTLLLKGPWQELEPALTRLGAVHIERLDIGLEEVLIRIMKKGEGYEQKVN